MFLPRTLVEVLEAYLIRISGGNRSEGQIRSYNPRQQDESKEGFGMPNLIRKEYSILGRVTKSRIAHMYLPARSSSESLLPQRSQLQTPAEPVIQTKSAKACNPPASAAEVSRTLRFTTRVRPAHPRQHRLVVRRRSRSTTLPATSRKSTITSEIQVHLLEMLPSAGDSSFPFPSGSSSSWRTAYLGGLSQREISERTGVPLGTVKSRTASAYKSLRKELVVQDISREVIR
jgi:hypothetical protein